MLYAESVAQRDAGPAARVPGTSCRCQNPTVRATGPVLQVRARRQHQYCPFANP